VISGARSNLRKLWFPGRLPVDLFERRVELADAGKEKLDAYAAELELDGLWTSVRAREELIIQALSALMLYQRDHHYV